MSDILELALGAGSQPAAEATVTQLATRLREAKAEFDTALAEGHDLAQRTRDNAQRIDTARNAYYEAEHLWLALGLNTGEGVS